MSKHRDNSLQGSLHGNGRCYWDVISTGDWAEDCRLGEEYARIWSEARTPKPQLAWIVRDMVATGRFTGVECGFVQRVFAAAEGRSLEMPIEQGKLAVDLGTLG